MFFLNILPPPPSPYFPFFWSLKFQKMKFFLISFILYFLFPNFSFKKNPTNYMFIPM
jgi:hypothetical protein